MTLNTKRLASVAKPRSKAAIERAEARKTNRDWLRMSQDIALSLHYYMRTSGMNQKELAERLSVSAAYVTKLLKGGENLTLDTICKIQNVIGQTLVYVCKPFIGRITLKVQEKINFSQDAVKSEKFLNPKNSMKDYVTADAA